MKRRIKFLGRRCLLRDPRRGGVHLPDCPSAVNEVLPFHLIGAAVHIIPTFDFQRLREGGATSAGQAPGARRGQA
jgi:hypothetical protein